MTAKVKPDYRVNRHTVALTPARHTDYSTIVWETNQQLLIRKTPHQLIRQACLENGSTYEGRRAAIMHHTGFERKVPIPIDPKQQLVAFSTHSRAHLNCSWLFYSHIHTILPPSASAKDQTEQTTVIFKNGQQLTLGVTYYILKKQMERTAMCMRLFENM